MAHQCVRCNKLYEDASQEILKGCGSCGGKFFFFIKKEGMNKMQEVASQLTSQDKEKIEQDVMEILGYEEDKPVILDLASVNISKPGKFELDLVKLFNNEPMVYKLDEGKYIIDIAETFKNSRTKNKKN
jgi:hypothetical protein